jgi:hypothetical protein
MVPLSNSVRSAGRPLPLHTGKTSYSPRDDEGNETALKNLKALGEQLCARCGDDPRRLRDMAKNFPHGGVIRNCLMDRAQQLEGGGTTGIINGSSMEENLVVMANRLAHGKHADELLRLAHGYERGSTIRAVLLKRAKQQMKSPIRSYPAGV